MWFKSQQLEQIERYHKLFGIMSTKIQSETDKYKRQVLLKQCYDLTTNIGDKLHQDLTDLKRMMDKFEKDNLKGI